MKTMVLKMKVSVNGACTVYHFGNCKLVTRNNMYELFLCNYNNKGRENDTFH